MKRSSITGDRSLETGDPFIRKYKILEKIGEGSYSDVLKCKSRESGELYACKRLKHCYKSWSQVNEIPELSSMRKLTLHPNILEMVEVFFHPGPGRVYLVFELMEMNLYELIKDRKRLLPEQRVKIFMFQIIRALRHLHKNGIFHRDVKPENILLKNDLVKIGDLGSVRGLYTKHPYTEYISTRWYRSPECLLTCGYYSFKMDVWAAGCVFFEILTLRPLFPGSSELDQIHKIHKILGPPPDKVLQQFALQAHIERDYTRSVAKQNRLDAIKHVIIELQSSSVDCSLMSSSKKGFEALLPANISREARDLLKSMLQYDPNKRPSSHRALQHPYFKDLREQARKAIMDRQTEQAAKAVDSSSEGQKTDVTLKEVPSDKFQQALQSAKRRPPTELPPSGSNDFPEIREAIIRRVIQCSRSTSISQGHVFPDFPDDSTKSPKTLLPKPLAGDILNDNHAIVSAQSSLLQRNQGDSRLERSKLFEGLNLMKPSETSQLAVRFPKITASGSSSFKDCRGSLRSEALYTSRLQSKLANMDRQIPNLGARKDQVVAKGRTFIKPTTQLAPTKETKPTHEDQMNNNNNNTAVNNLWLKNMEAELSNPALSLPKLGPKASIELNATGSTTLTDQEPLGSLGKSEGQNATDDKMRPKAEEDFSTIVQQLISRVSSSKNKVPRSGGKSKPIFTGPARKCDPRGSRLAARIEGLSSSSRHLSHKTSSSKPESLLSSSLKRVSETTPRTSFSDKKRHSGSETEQKRRDRNKIRSLLDSSTHTVSTLSRLLERDSRTKNPYSTNKRLTYKPLNRPAWQQQNATNKTLETMEGQRKNPKTNRQRNDLPLRISNSKQNQNNIKTPAVPAKASPLLGGKLKFSSQTYADALNKLNQKFC